jgi:hypothetical protein
MLQAEFDAAALSVEEPNLLDLEEVDLSEPSPVTNGTPGSTANGFGGSQASPPGPPTQGNIVASKSCGIDRVYIRQFLHQLSRARVQHALCIISSTDLWTLRGFYVGRR